MTKSFGHRVRIIVERRRILHDQNYFLMTDPRDFVAGHEPQRTENV